MSWCCVDQQHSVFPVSATNRKFVCSHNCSFPICPQHAQWHWCPVEKYNVLRQWLLKTVSYVAYIYWPFCPCNLFSFSFCTINYSRDLSRSNTCWGHISVYLTNGYPCSSTLKWAHIVFGNSMCARGHPKDPLPNPTPGCPPDRLAGKHKHGRGI